MKPRTFMVVVALVGGCLGEANESSAQGKTPGLWSRATTLATLRGRWLNEDRYRAFRKADDPDAVLSYFAPVQSRLLVSVALETGFQPFLEARNQPGKPIAIVEKHLEVIYRVSSHKVLHGGLMQQPTFVLRRTRLPAAPPPGAGPLPVPEAGLLPPGIMR